MLAIGTVVAGLFAPAARAARYVTWEGFEADKLASIWLIKRYIDHDAVFEFLPAGTKPISGIPFDTPFGRLARRPDRSSFEVIAARYHIHDPGIEMIGRYIHDIEINTWEDKKYPQSREIRRFTSVLLSSKIPAQEIIDKAVLFFDRLYEKSLPCADNSEKPSKNRPVPKTNDQEESRDATTYRMP